MNWREVVYDVWSSLKQNFEEGELTLFHTFYWTCVFADRIKSQHIEKRDSGAYLTSFIDIPVFIEPDTNRRYFKLPFLIYDFDKDRAINYISYTPSLDLCNPPFTSVTFTRTTPATSRILYYTEEEKPSPSNPYFYRKGDNVYFLGLEDININFIEAGLYVTFNVDNLPDLDTEFPFPQETIQILMIQLMEYGRYVLMIPSDKVNDGTMAKTNKSNRGKRQQAQQEQQEQQDQEVAQEEQQNI